MNDVKTFRKGGIHPVDHKLSAGEQIRTLPLPEKVFIPVSQHLGAPAKPEVMKGDDVKTGQVLATVNGYVSANIHSSVSGKVQKIDTFNNSVIFDLQTGDNSLGQHRLLAPFTNFDKIL